MHWNTVNRRNLLLEREEQTGAKRGRDVPPFAVHSHGSHPTNPEAVTLLGTEHQQLHTYPGERFCYQVLQGFSLMGLEDNVIFLRWAHWVGSVLGN